MIYSDLYGLDTGFIKTLLDSENADATELFSEFTNPDYYINSKIGLKTLITMFENVVKDCETLEQARLKIANIILSTNLQNWKRIKDVMSENYEVFLVADEQYTENVSEGKESVNANNGTVQNKVNAFDSNTDTNTEKVESNNNGTGAETLTREMTYRKKSTGALYTPQELLEKEIELRTNNKFLDIIVKDIKTALCIDVY